MTIEIKDYVLINPPDLFNEVETTILQQTLANALIKRYLHTLLWNSLRDLGSIPMTELNTELYRLQHAYVKGGIGMLMTLLSIDTTTPPSS